MGMDMVEQPAYTGLCDRGGIGRHAVLRGQ